MQDLNDKVTGDSLTATEWNEVPSEIQNVIEGLGIALSGADLNQLGKAIAGYVANGNFYIDSGAADAYVLAKIGLKQTAPAYTDGMEISFRPGNNNTGASTVNVAGLGLKNIKTPAGLDPNADALVAGKNVFLRYDSANGWFTLETPSLIDDFTSAEQTITPLGSLTIAHGLSAAPELIQARLICKTAEDNYSIGDEVIISPDTMSSSVLSNYGMSVVPDATNINIRYGNASPVFIIADKTSGVIVEITPANWRLIVRAWA